MSEYFAVWKSIRSKPIDEDQLIYHLAEEGGCTLCNSEKRSPGLYDFGNGPLIDVESNELFLCKTCYKIHQILKKNN